MPKTMSRAHVEEKVRELVRQLREQVRAWHDRVRECLGSRLRRAK